MRRELHPELAFEERRRLFFTGVSQFNEGRFFASHEAWEEIWRSTTPEPRDLFQGLIQVAAGMHHFRCRSRPRVAARVLAKGRRRLEGLPSPCLGVELEDLLESVRQWEAWLETTVGEPPADPCLTVRDPARFR